MASYNNLKFFNKTGENLNLEFNQDLGYWEGTIYFPKVSVDLYENEQIFILEQVLYGSPDVPTLTFPILGQQSSPVKEQWGTRWETNDSKDQIRTYLITEENNTPFITFVDNVYVDNAAVPYTEGSPGTMKMVTSINSAPMQFDISFSSDDEDIYERTIIIEDLSYSTPKIVAKIGFYGETVGEDERLRLVLENFGRNFTQRDALIIRDYDIKEGLPNWQQINEKRKELFIAGEEIFPYIGSYRGLINIVRFFGYQDLRIKEYWLNIDQKAENFGKISQVQIEGLLDDSNNPILKNPLRASKAYRKTGQFGLFYDITVENGLVDEFGTPITVNAFMFSNEEVLIKLFALKEKLKQYYMPLNARIVDIVGEGIYFDRYGIRTWTDELNVFDTKVAINVDFVADPNVGYIRDLRKFQVKRFSPGLDLPVERFTNLVNPYTMGQDYPAYSLPGLVDSIHAFYKELSSFIFPYLDEKSEFIGDEPGILGGCPVIFNAIIAQFTWDDMDMSWDATIVAQQFVSPMVPLPNKHYTWDTLDFSNFYEIEWTIEKTESPNPYLFSFRGSVYDYHQLPHFLPFAGKYRVTMEIFDLFNARSIQIKNEYIEVFNREIEIGAFMRWRDFDYYTWDGTKDNWDILGGSTWHFPIEGLSLYNSPLHEKLINWPRYRNQFDAKIFNNTLGVYENAYASGNPNAGQFGTFNLIWHNMHLPWDEMYHSTWNMYDYHGEFLGGFKIYSPELGDQIQIDDYPPFQFVDTTPSLGFLDLFEAVAQLKASTNKGIMKFDYHVFEGPASPPYIEASGKFPGPDSWHFVNYIPISSPAQGTIDPNTWIYPSWIRSQNSLLDLISRYPGMDPELLFLDVPFQDLINNSANNLAYWQNAGFIKTEDPTPEFPGGERRGHLPSWYGSGAFTNGDLRVFKDSFTVPLGTPVFLVDNHSEIPGKTNERWIITNELSGEVVLDVRHKFAIITFLDESVYTVELYLDDTNNNRCYVKRKGFIKVSSRANMNKPQIDVNLGEAIIKL